MYSTKKDEGNDQITVNIRFSSACTMQIKNFLVTNWSWGMVIKPCIQIPFKTPQCLKLNFDFWMSVKNPVTALKFAFYVNTDNWSHFFLFLSSIKQKYSRLLAWEYTKQPTKWYGKECLKHNSCYEIPWALCCKSLYIFMVIGLYILMCFDYNNIKPRQDGDRKPNSK